MSKPDLTNLLNCIEDVKQSVLDGDAGPSDPTDYDVLRKRLKATRTTLPPLYIEAVFNPYVSKLDELGPTGFGEILTDDPGKQGKARLMLDIAHAILQNGEKYSERAMDAFQEVVSDLYDGFLRAEGKIGVKPPDKGGIPPLVKWGGANFGPYTWPVDMTSYWFGLQTAIISLPPTSARCGLLNWAALSHETAGHDILNADTGLLPELKTVVRKTLEKANLGHSLPAYWARRLEESASDVLGILNMGPAGGIGLIGAYRGRNAARAGIPKLRSEMPKGDPHPADVLRGFLAASTVRLLSFDGADDWADCLAEETAKDVSSIRLDGIEVGEAEARLSAEVVAKTLVHSKVESLENHSLGEIQDWRDNDEGIVEELHAILNTASELPDDYASGIYAAHAVAAAIMAAISKDANLPLLFDKMLAMLKKMHYKNPSWGPSFVTPPRNIVPIKVYFDSESLEPRERG